MKFEGYLCK